MSCYSLHRLDEWLMIWCSIKEVTSVTPGIDSPELCQNICQVLTLTIDFLVSRIHAYRFFPFSSAARYAILLFFVDIRIETTLCSFLGCKAGETVDSFISRQIQRALPSLGPRHPFLSSLSGFWWESYWQVWKWKFFGQIFWEQKRLLFCQSFAFLRNLDLNQQTFHLFRDIYLKLLSSQLRHLLLNWQCHWVCWLRLWVRTCCLCI